MDNIKWFQIHDEISNFLILFYQKHNKNAGKELYNVFSKYQDKCIQTLPFTKKFFEKENKNARSFDPIHIFASINYYDISPKERKKRLEFYYEIFNLNKTKLNKINYQNTFYTYPHLNIVHLVGMRINDIQEEVWEFFHGVVKDNSTVIEKYFDKAIDSWYGIQIPSLTVFMFWINSSKFLPLDQFTVRYLQENFIIEKQPKDYNTYINTNKIFLSYKFSKDIFRTVTCMALNKKTNDISSAKKKEIEKLNDEYIKEYGSLKDLEKINNDFQNEVKKSINSDPDDRRKRLKNANPNARKSRMTIKYYHRNPDVVAEVLDRADGKCECCHQIAPFYRKKDGSLYLEVHHKKPLSKGGKDVVSNAEALCPNCHRKKHFG